MIDLLSVLLEYVVIFLAIIVVVQLLKRRGLFIDEYQPVFDRLVTEFALPAVIFSSLATISYWDHVFIASTVLFASVTVTGVVIYAVCRLLKLPRKTTGALIMMGAFGSTYTLAVPVIGTIYGEQSMALTAIIAEGALGVAIPFFTIGVLVAMYFGMEEGTDASLPAALKQFLLTPIFIAFVLGVIVSILGLIFGLPGQGFFTDIFTGFFGEIQYSLELLVWISVGLMIRPQKLSVFIPFAGLVIGAKMILQPVLAMIGATAMGLPLLSQQALIILAAMPSGAIATVLANRYGCDGKLAAGLLVGTYIASLVIFPVIVYFL